MTDWINDLELALGQGNFDATDTIVGAIEDAPGYALHAWNLHQIYALESNNRDEADRAARQMCGLGPGGAYLAACTYRSSGEVGKAVDCFLEVIRSGDEAFRKYTWPSASELNTTLPSQQHE